MPKIALSVTILCARGASRWVIDHDRDGGPTTRRPFKRLDADK
jgi:hypothetical protein